MKSIRADRKKLVEILKKNREEHRKIFLEALDGYKKKVLEILEGALERASAATA